MVTHKRKKNSRQHGKHTHGWGAMKKHRGSGNKGGVGNAGSGKRADTKKPSYWKNRLYFGMHGFVKKGQIIEMKCVNICDLPKYSDKAEITLADFGFNKLLGSGKPGKAYTITVDFATQPAIKKIEEAKGKVILKGEK